MSVGKTPISIQVIEQNGYHLPLIVCPNSLRYEWLRQIEEWTGLKGVTTRGNTYTRLTDIIRSLTKGVKYRVINYETLRSEDDRELLSVIPFDIIIFDEIHKLRNPKTQVAKGVWKFLEGYPNTKIIGLTGSPIVNYPNDLYTPLSIVHPEEYPRNHKNWRYFMQRYCLWSEGRHGAYIYGTKDMPELRKRTAPLTIRRTKEEVLPFLPPKYYRRAELEMPPEQRKLYDQMATELRVLLDTGEPLWSSSVLATLTRLRQINLEPKILGISAPSAKTEFLYDLIEATDEKLVIYSCFENYIYWLSRVFDEQKGRDGLQKTPYVTITGKVSPEQRVINVERFQSDPSIRLCLGTIKTMGEGYTLTAASTVILMDRWWNEPTNEQAVDRLHRISQEEAVEVVYPICLNSVDEALDRILQTKAQATQEYLQETQVRERIFASLLDI